MTRIRLEDQVGRGVFASMAAHSMRTAKVVRSLLPEIAVQCVGLGYEL